MVCLLCRRPSDSELCDRHVKSYVFDQKYDWFRKKKKLPRGVRRYEATRKYGRSERKLDEILSALFGSDNIVISVHPRWLISPETGALLEYDACVIPKKLFIEYNGIQHVEFPNYFHRTRAEFNAQQLRDKIKLEAAYQHGWRLLVLDHQTKMDYGTVKGIVERELAK